jgi:hypothetical protein
MDLIGPARLCSVGGKWYVLVIVDDYSRYAWVFFLVVRAIRSDNGSEFKNLISKHFVVIWISNISFLLPMWLVRMVWLRGRIVPFVR